VRTVKCHCYFPVDLPPPPGKQWAHNPACVLTEACWLTRDTIPSPPPDDCSSPALSPCACWARGLPVESPAEALLVAIELLEMCAEKLGREEVRSELNRVLNDLWHASN
jgi:hypothetical protein